MSEHVILVAFDVDADSREAAEEYLRTHFPITNYGRHQGWFEGDAYLNSWWVAEDDRRDGSDNDSAVFVQPGSQRVAWQVLCDAGITASHNIPVECTNVWESVVLDGWWYNAKHDEDETIIWDAARAFLNSEDPDWIDLGELADALGVNRDDVEAISR